LLVDDQFAPLTEKILTAVSQLSDKPVKFVINTHWHGDHVGGNENLGKTATIIAHDNVRQRMSTKQVMEFFQRTSEPSPKEALPVVTFAESLTVHFNNEEIKVIHFPHGHTDGDSVVFFPKSNVVHVGDHLFSGAFPYVDLGSGGDVQGYGENVAKIIDEINDDTKIIPGHGPLSSKKELEEFYQMIIATTNIIRKRIESGKSLEEIQAEGLDSQWDIWGKGFISVESWIKIVHESLKRK